jgi:hypothetical protein
VKITDLVDDGLLDSDEHGAFAAATLQVLSTSFESEPYETSFLCEKFDLDTRKIEKYTSKIIRHLESSDG